MEKIHTVKIYDSEYETTYTANIQKNGSGWIGWIQEHPKVKCEDSTQEALLETLERTLYKTLEADWEAWDKQIEEDVKAGRLDKLGEKALEICGQVGAKIYSQSFEHKQSHSNPKVFTKC